MKSEEDVVEQISCNLVGLVAKITCLRLSMATVDAALRSILCREILFACIGHAVDDLAGLWHGGISHADLKLRYGYICSRKKYPS